jgi:hypothetical protein
MASKGTLESISLTMDMASVENMHRTEVSFSVVVWAIVSKIYFPKLRALRLRGWEIFPECLDPFFIAHGNTLVDLTMEDCMLIDGNWHLVLLRLIASASLRSLKLFQLSEDFWRIHFPTKSESNASVEVLHDWSWVTRDQYTASILPCESWDLELAKIIIDMQRNGQLAYHGADHAAYWR